MQKKPHDDDHHLKLYIETVGSPLCGQEKIMKFYARLDREIVDQIVNELKKDGYVFWKDDTEMGKYSILLP